MADLGVAIKFNNLYIEIFINSSPFKWTLFNKIGSGKFDSFIISEYRLFEFIVLKSETTTVVENAAVSLNDVSNTNSSCACDRDTSSPLRPLMTRRPMLRGHRCACPWKLTFVLFNETYDWRS
jgi:hypothetical protein